MSIVIHHNAGFFSNCSIILLHIVNYINLNKKLPDTVDSSNSFAWYKVNTTRDITYDYFEDSKNIDVNMELNNSIYYHQDYQFENYSTIQYDKIIPLIKKYFTVSSTINNIIKDIEQKYLLDYENICVLFYRGNDKNTETLICGYDEYLHYANEIIQKNPDVKFLIQSDETEFIEFIRGAFPDNSFFFKDEIRHMRKCNSTVDINMRDKIEIYSKYYLAITCIMAKCKYIVCGSGNCSIWTIFYRGHNKNVWQNLNSKWITP